MIKKIRPQIKQLTKVRSLLQQEINSMCPFCNGTDVGHFQIHHIDENPANNLIPNLLLVCPTCHSKITKGDLTRLLVKQAKRDLPIKHQIEVATIAVDRKNCSWDNYDNVSNAFFQTEENKSPFPIFSFSLINHTSKTILLKEIRLKAKHLFSGLSGIPRPRILKSLVKLKIQIPSEKKITLFKLTNEIEVPAGQAFKFQIQVFDQWENKIFPIDGRKVLFFTFLFNSKISIISPTIFLNCKSENEKMKLFILS